MPTQFTRSSADLLQLLLNSPKNNFQFQVREVTKKKLKKELNNEFFAPYASGADLFFSAAKPVLGILTTLTDVIDNLLDSIKYFFDTIGNALLLRGEKAKESAKYLGASLVMTVVTAALTVISPLLNAIAFFTRLSSSYSSEQKMESSQDFSCGPM